MGTFKDLTPLYQLYMEALTQESTSHEPVLTKTRLQIYKTAIDTDDTQTGGVVFNSESYHIEAYRIIDSKLVKIVSKLKDSDINTLLNKLKVIAGFNTSDFITFSNQ